MKSGLHKISVKLLAFNILLLSLPMVSLLYLDTYESQLLKAQENSMIQQGRILSAALTGSSDIVSDASKIIENLNRRVDSRIRVVDADGRLIADSSMRTEIAIEQDSDPKLSYGLELPTLKISISAEDTILYRIVVYPINAIKTLLLPPAPELGSGEYYSGKTLFDGQEIRAALEGRYGAATRFSSGGQRSINLYSAIPVYEDESESLVKGAVLVSRSTFQILSFLYELRLDIIRIFLIFLIVSIVLSFGLSMSITGPVVKLKNEAGNILDDSGNFRSHFTGFRRRDEIGELSRSLTHLSSDLEKKMDFINKFTSDMLHELKNPMSAIKGSAEMALRRDVDSAVLLHNIIEEEKRMERMLAELREISSLESVFDNEKKEIINLFEILPVILSRYQGVHFTDHSDGKSFVLMNIDRLVQAVTNPVDNAISFSPEGKGVLVELYSESGICRIEIVDNGPGIVENEKEFVFDRFYSGRTEDGRKGHSGLGLSIVKSIITGYGGDCRIENTEQGGCRFSIFLPACRE